MPFDPRQKSRSTTSLPALLRDELGIQASTSKSHFRPGHNQKADKRHQYNARKGNPQQQPYQLKVIGRPQNNAPKGSKQGPIKSLRNQEKEQQTASASAAVDHTQSPKKRKHAQPIQDERRPAVGTSQRTESAKISRPSNRSLKRMRAEAAATEPVNLPTRLNPFTGEMEAVKPAKKASATTKSTALERMMQKADQGSTNKASASKKSRKHMTDQEKEEEDEIRWLEYHLHKGQQAGNDGEEPLKDDLDDFLDDLDRFQVGMYEDEDADSSELSSSDSESQSTSESDPESSAEDDEQAASGEEDMDSDSEASFEEEEEGTQFDSNDEDDFSNWDAAMATTDEDQDGDSESDESADSEAEEALALLDGSAYSAPAKESAPITAESAVATPAAGKYIPPALRAKMAAAASQSATSATPVEDDLASQKLRRQAQGLLNKLGDGNIDTIVTEIEALYRTNPRAKVTSILTQLILDTVTSRSNLVDTFVILHGAFVAALHKVVGVEFAAFFIQRMIEDLLSHYERLSKSAEEEDEGNKTCLNLTVLACELYNLQVVACPLIYDLIRLFLGQAPGTSAPAANAVGEMDVELILKTIRSCGPQLRHDDPSALKDILALTTSRLSSTSIRSKFMVERMQELLKASTSVSASKRGAASNDANDPSSPAGQLLSRMKKYLGGMAKKRSVKSYEPLRIGLKDLQDADKKGKWWLVGSAWTGQTDQDDAHGLTKLLPMNAKASAMQTPGSNQDAGVAEQQELLAMARSQGMNTDARRAVFITLVTSEDYKQATESLLQLKLNETQRREVVRVLVHCAGSEKEYNPYYTLIGQEICKHNHGMRVTLQYCLWDFLRQLGAKEVGGEKFASSSLTDSLDDGKAVDPIRVTNLARCFAWWLTHDCLSLQALKVVDFTAIQPGPTQFLGLVFIFCTLSIQSPNSSARVLDMSTLTKRPLQKETIHHFVQAGLVGGNTDLSRGLLFFIKSQLKPKQQRTLVLGHDKKLKSTAQPLLTLIEEAVASMIESIQTLVNRQADAVDPLSENSDNDSV